jgi:hypothetical protein
VKKERLHPRKPRLTAVGIRWADHATPSARKRLALTSLTSGGRSVGIVPLQTTATEFSFVRLFWCTLTLMVTLLQRNTFEISSL